MTTQQYIAELQLYQMHVASIEQWQEIQMHIDTSLNA